MNLRRLGVIATTLGLATTAAVAAAPAATASGTATGTRSLAAVLTSDGNRFDRNWYDYDIVTEAVLAVLAAKPASPVGLLTDGTVPLTAFIPNDRAFQVLAHDLTKKWPGTEEKTFDALVARRRRRRHRAGAALPRGPGRRDHQEGRRERQRCRADDRPGRRPSRCGSTAGTCRSSSCATRTPTTSTRSSTRGPSTSTPGNAQIAHGIVFVLRPLDL